VLLRDFVPSWLKPVLFCHESANRDSKVHEVNLNNLGIYKSNVSFETALTFIRFLDKFCNSSSYFRGVSYTHAMRAPLHLNIQKNGEISRVCFTTQRLNQRLPSK